MQTEPQLDLDRIRQLPKIELHSHLPGAIRTSTILEFAEEYGIDLPTRDPEQLKTHLQAQPGKPTDLATLLRTLGKVTRKCFPSREAISRLAYEMVEDAYDDGIVYLEVRFSPSYMAADRGLPLETVLEGVADGLERAGKQLPVKTGMLLGLTRETGIEKAMETARLAVSAGRELNVVGVDLSGEEADHPAKEFAPAFDYIHTHSDLGVTIHAGEAAGPESVRDAILVLGANRIGHGVRAIEDEAVMDLVRERRVVLETCPTSNTLTGAVPGFSSHPLPRFLEAGILATINSDDPSWFATTLSREYQLAREEIGLTAPQLKQAALNAVEGIFQDENTRRELREQLRTAYDRL